RAGYPPRLGGAVVRAERAARDVRAVHGARDAVCRAPEPVERVMTEPNWRTFSGWCLELWRPNCEGCRDDTCGCPGCVAKRSGPAQNKGNERGSAVLGWENVSEA